MLLAYHGTDGPLRINHANHITKLGPAFVEAGRHLGYQTGDYNGDWQTRFSISQTTTFRGKRVTAANAYLEPIKLHRKNLEVLTYATAKRVIFTANRRAVAVLFERFMSDHKVYARKEIILSAGAFQSPKLLQVSTVVT